MGDIKIENIIDKINRNFFLPDIQREFVWLETPSDKQIEKFFDSIIKGYPIGMFLVWEISKEKAKDMIIYKFIESYNRNSENHNQEQQDIKSIPNDPFTLVLDGQQRLTALCIGLKGGIIKNNEKYELYINLNYEPNYENYEDTYQIEFRKSAESDDNTKKWFKIKDILGMKVGEIEPEYKGIQVKILYRLIDAVRSTLSLYTIEQDKTFNEVLQIFIKVNSGGQKLDASDLLMSVIISAFQRKGKNIREEIFKLIDDWKEEGFNQIDKDLLFKTFLLMQDNTSITLKYDSFEDRQISYIIDNWNTMIRSINKTLELLEIFGYTNMKFYKNIIPSIALYYYKNGNRDISEEDKKNIKKFIELTNISKFFGKSTDSQLMKFKKAMNNIKCFEDIINNLYESKEIEIDEKTIKDIVDNTKKGNAKQILQLLYPDYDYENMKFHIDHIYPKAKFAEEKLDYEKKKDCLFNLQLLTGRKNRKKSQTDPQKWIDETYPEEKEKKKYLKNNYIPADMLLTWENIEEFEEKRKEMLVKRLKEIFNIQ